MVTLLKIMLPATEVWCHSNKAWSSKFTSALKSTLEEKSIRNPIWGAWASIYEVSIVVVTATTLLLKRGAWVYDWASKEHLWGAELISWAGYSGEKYHFSCLNSCPVWHCIFNLCQANSFFCSLQRYPLPYYIWLGTRICFNVFQIICWVLKHQALLYVWSPPRGW